MISFKISFMIFSFTFYQSFLTIFICYQSPSPIEIIMVFSIPILTQDEGATIAPSPFEDDSFQDTQDDEATKTPSPFENVTFPQPKLKTNTKKMSLMQLNILEHPVTPSTKTSIVKSHRKGNGILVVSFTCHVEVVKKRPSTGSKKTLQEVCEIQNSVGQQGKSSTCNFFTDCR